LYGSKEGAAIYTLLMEREYEINKYNKFIISNYKPLLRYIYSER
jgi:hypothetical protein